MEDRHIASSTLTNLGKESTDTIDPADSFLLFKEYLESSDEYRLLPEEQSLEGFRTFVNDFSSLENGEDHATDELFHEQANGANSINEAWSDIGLSQPDGLLLTIIPNENSLLSVQNRNDQENLSEISRGFVREDPLPRGLETNDLEGSSIYCCPSVTAPDSNLAPAKNRKRDIKELNKRVTDAQDEASELKESDATEDAKGASKKKKLYVYKPGQANSEPSENDVENFRKVLIQNFEDPVLARTKNSDYEQRNTQCRRLKNFLQEMAYSFNLGSLGKQLNPDLWRTII